MGVIFRLIGAHAVATAFAVSLLCTGCYMQPSMERLLSSAANVGPGGNGDGYEGIHKFRAFAFEKQVTPCGLPYSKWIEFDLDKGQGVKVDTCSGQILRALTTADLVFPPYSSYRLVIVDGEIYEIRTQAEANAVNPATENFAVVWCSGTDSADPRNKFEFIVRGIGGTTNYTLETKYVIYDAGGNATAGTHLPEAVLKFDDGTEYSWDNGSNYKVHFDYTVPLAGGTFGGSRSFIQISGTIYRPDVICRYKPY